MVKLDVTLLRYLKPEDFKVLTSVEMGMKNHELVPGPLISSIATLRFGGCGKILVELTKHKLLAFERGKRFDGYRLTYAGYDYLALNALVHREVVGGVGNQIGVGKESDVFICESPDQQQCYAIKFHRLGRVCFRRVSEKRDFYTKSKNKTSWIYLSRKAAQREYEFLRLMHCKGMPVPKPIDCNRHVVVLELINGQILNHFTEESFYPEELKEKVAKLYRRLMDLILRFANETRVVHGDFNEFNILIKNDDHELEPVIIDFPQMLCVDHELAPEHFERDVHCIVDFFNKRFHYESDYIPKWADVEDNIEKDSQIDRFLEDAIKAMDEDDEASDSVDEPSTRLDAEDAMARSSAPVSGRDCTFPEPVATVSDGAKAKGDCLHEEDRLNRLVDEIDDCASQFGTMVINRSDARERLKSELNKRENNRRRRQAAKPKNIKGESNPVRRRRKTNQLIVVEDADLV